MIHAHAITKRKKITATVNPSRTRKPAKKRKRHAGAPRRKTNNPATVLLGYLNPTKGKQMPARRKKARKTARRKHATKRSNPVFAVKRRSTGRRRGGARRRRNPITARSILTQPMELLKAGGIGATAYFATRQVPQLVLKGRNTGWMGYIANALTAIASAAAADRYFGPTAGHSAFVGGGMAVFSRVILDNTGIGQQLKQWGAGDVAAPALGRLVPGYWAQPPIVDRAGNPVWQPQLMDVLQAQCPKCPPAPVALTTTAGVGRFNSPW